MLRGLRLLLVVFEKLLADSLRDEDLLQVVERGQSEGNPGGREGSADGGEREVTRLLAAGELGVLQVEDAFVVAEDHAVHVGEEHAETHLAPPNEAFSRADLFEKVPV